MKSLLSISLISILLSVCNNKVDKQPEQTAPPVPEQTLVSEREAPVMDGANQYLQSVFIPTFWRDQIEVLPRNVDTEFAATPEHIDLDDIFVVRVFIKSCG